jgi:methyl-accepting chemotaxis protein
VKSLAGQTTRATEDIAQQVSQIQDATRNTVEAIRSMTSVIAEVHGIGGVISAAVEQQQAATQDIAKSIAQATHGTEEVTNNILQVQQAAASTGNAAGRVLTSAGELTRCSDELTREVESFLAGIRAA